VTRPPPEQPAARGGELALPRDAAYWAKPVGRLDIAQIPTGAISLNVSGRRVVGPVQGFGQMWQKTYRVRLEGSAATPAEVVRAWKEHLPRYQPTANRFFPSVHGVAPGEVVLINAVVQGMPALTGVLVVYADDEAFTLMTPEGHPESGWVTFSAYHDKAGCLVAQVQSIARANDPIYEFGFRWLGGARQQEGIWTHVLVALAADFGVRGEVTVQKTCVDARLQWSGAKNVWQNAVVRSMLYLLLSPLRQARGPRQEGRILPLTQVAKSGLTASGRQSEGGELQTRSTGEE
jgi:Domain of unknown function (DUF1990)